MTPPVAKWRKASGCAFAAIVTFPPACAFGYRLPEAVRNSRGLDCFHRVWPVVWYARLLILWSWTATRLTAASGVISGCTSLIRCAAPRCGRSRQESGPPFRRRDAKGGMVSLSWAEVVQPRRVKPHARYQQDVGEHGAGLAVGQAGGR